MRHLRQVAAVFFLFCMVLLQQASAQQSSFDVDAYRQFLEQHQDMEGSTLLSDYPAPLLKSTVAGPVQQAAWLDSISLTYKLTKDELDLLAENGFVVTERLTAETFQAAYQDIWHKDLPVLVTTDAILHALHMSYDRILKDTEQYYLIGELRTILQGLYDAQENLVRTHGSKRDLAPMLRDVDVYLAVAWRLLTGELRMRYPENAPVVSDLLANIDAEQPANVTLFSSTPRIYDFSQFTIRGHYTDSPQLGQYFQSMIWIGRTELMLTKPVQHDVPQQKDEDIQRQIIDAYLIAEAMDIADVRGRLQKVDRLLETIVGESDNVRAVHLEELAGDIGLSSPADLLDMNRVKEFQSVLKSKSFASQRINSQILYSNPFNPEQLQPPSAFLLLGQRFIIDSYVFGNVVYDKILFRGQKVRRMLPSSMDALFALGNDAAAQFLQDEFARYPYASNLNALRYLVDSYGEDFWSASLYNSWLHSIRALNIPDDIEQLPEFMQTAAWWQQKMNTQLSSWAQLRHDNLLYAKQSYTGGVSCSFPEGYVEPYPEFYARIASFARSAETVFEEPMPGVSFFFERMANTMDTLQSIAEKELSGDPLTMQEAGFVKRMLFLLGVCGMQYDGWYLRLFYGYEDPEEDYVTADVHTAPTDASGSPVGWVYHLGTGFINLGIVVAPAQDGTPTAFIGPMMSFHEHVTTNFDRLTDERWTEMLGRGTFTRPVWTNNWLADAAGQRREAGPSLMTGVTSVTPATRPVADACILHDSYPNPFTATEQTTISFAVNKPLKGSVLLSVYDINGRRVRQLIARDLPVGRYMAQWDGTDDGGATLPAGRYVVVLESSAGRLTTSLVLLR